MIDNLSAEHVYRETFSSIHATDDISFKLMGIVPLLSGATLLTFFLKEGPLAAGFLKEGPLAADKASVVVFLSLFGALVTLGLFRWELRNIQTCKWLRRRAEAFERVFVTAAGVTSQPSPPLRIGKTEAEKWIYSVTIFAWLCTPTVLFKFASQPWWLPIYIASAVLIVLPTAYSVLRPVRVSQVVDWAFFQTDRGIVLKILKGSSNNRFKWIEVNSDGTAKSGMTASDDKAPDEIEQLLNANHAEPYARQTYRNRD